MTNSYATTTQVQDLFRDAYDFALLRHNPAAADSLLNKALHLDVEQADLWRLLLTLNYDNPKAPQLLERIHKRSRTFGDLVNAVSQPTSDPALRDFQIRLSATLKERGKSPVTAAQVSIEMSARWSLPFDIPVSLHSPIRVTTAWAAYNAFALNDYATAAEILSAAPNPDHPAINAVWTLMYWKTGRWADAQRVAAKLFQAPVYYVDEVTEVTLDGDPAYDITLRALGYLIDGMAYAHLGQDSLAQDRLRIVYSSGENFPSQIVRAAYHTLGLLSRARGAGDDADAWFSRAKAYGTTPELDADIADPNKRLVFTSAETIDLRTSYWDPATEPSMEQIADKRRVEEGQSVLVSAMAKLNRQIGLEDVKRKVHEFASQERMNQFYRDQGIDPDTDSRYSFVFVGAPGTGKTVTARAIVDLLFAYGIIKENKFEEVSAADLVGSHVGEAEKLTTEALKKADNGVLFIDEIYQLTQKGDSAGGSNANAYGKKAAETILKYMEDNGDICHVIIAGYEEETNLFLDSNPGFKSRFTDTLYFKSYTAEELGQIALLMAGDRKPPLTFSDDAYQHFVDRCQGMSEPYHDGRTVGDIAGNGRMVRKAIDAMRKNISVRLSSILGQENHQLTVKDATTITVEDVDAAMDPIMKSIWGR